MRIYGLTDRGMVREINEDSIGISSFANGLTVALVCDGMGGAAGGKTASEIAESVFSETVEAELCSAVSDEGSPSPLDVKKLKAALEAGVSKANEAIFEHSLIHEELQGMGCTLNAVIYSEETRRLCFANVGDSRLYMINKKEIKQLSKDHSFVQYLVDTGEITQEEAANHPKKNLITRAVGIDVSVKADISYIKVPSKKPTCFLLCSDGLHGLVSPDVIKEIAMSEQRIEDKVIALIRSANNAGGHDNVSAILLQINENSEGATKK